MRLWAQIAATLAIHLAVLTLLVGGLVLQQTNAGLDSLLYAPARERVRELGRMVEENFSDTPPAQRDEFLAEIGRPHGIALAVYDDAGRLIAGQDLHMPAQARAEFDGANDQERRRARRRGRAGGPRMFLVKEWRPSRYWFGYYFPLSTAAGHPPARHLLAVVVPSLLTNSFFFNWWPWIGGAIVAIALTVVCWFPLVRRLNRAVQAVRTASAEIAEGRFDVRIPVTGNDELGELAGSIQRMAVQLSNLVQGQRRFLADVAHELCAPLSRIQLSAGILSQSAPPANLIAVARLERDVSHMSALVGDLLSFTKGNERAPQLEHLALHEIVGRAVEQEAMPGVELDVNVEPGLGVFADEEYLTRALANVVRNAIRYAGRAGPVTINAKTKSGMTELVVSDCGPGIPESDLEAVFAPFYRPDSVRTPGVGGVGLGLAIVASCVEACGGTVTCRNREPQGLEVTIVLRQC